MDAGVEWDEEALDATVEGDGTISTDYGFGSEVVLGSGGSWSTDWVEVEPDPLLDQANFSGELPAFGEIAFFETLHTGMATGDGGFVEALTSGTIVDMTFTNDGDAGPMTIDLIVSLISNIVVEVDDPANERALGLTTFEFLVGSDCSDADASATCESLGFADAYYDTLEGVDSINEDGDYPFELALEPGESVNFVVAQSTYAEAQSVGASEVPLPGALPLLGGAVAGLGLLARRRAQTRD
jgi:hypothetical protein